MVCPWVEVFSWVVLLVVLDRLRVDSVLQHPALVVVREGCLLLELEQAGLAVAPLVPGQPELLVLLELGLVPRADGVLELLAGECKVHAVRVHLDEFEVLPVEVEVQELVVELEHAELRELVDHDAHLEWAGDVDLALAQLDLVGVANLIEVLEPG